jgi:glycosyltransferase involved in cell wall biosynthesis
LKREDYLLKKILFITPTGGYAGIDVCLETLVCGLDRTKYEPVVIFPKGAKLKEKFDEIGILNYELPLKWWFPIGFSGSNILDMFQGIKDTVDPIVGIIKDNSIDLVVSNTSANFDGAFAAAICNKPHIFYIHAQYASNIYVHMKQETRELLYSFMGKFSHKLVCCSKLLHEYISNFSNNSMYIYNGVNTERFQYKNRTIIHNATIEKNHHKQNKANKTINLVSVGHYNANKQQDFVIEALNIIKKKKPAIINSISYTMVGPGEAEYKRKLKELTEKYELEENVFFEDFRDDIERYLYNFNIYINSSVTENLPVSVLEAMSSGLPVLGTPNDGVLQLVDDRITGFITKTPEEMADRIIYLFENPQIIEEMSERSREKVETGFTEQQYIINFEKLFDDIDVSYSLGKEFADFINKFYLSISRKALIDYRPLNALVLYPPQAMATYYIGAKNPLDYLKNLKVLSYKSVTPQDYSDNDLDKADIVYCIRYYDDFAYELLKKAKRQGKPFIWLIDDNYSALKFENNKRIDVEYKNVLYERMYKESNAVLVDSGTLYRFGSKLTENIYRLATYQVNNEDLIKGLKKDTSQIKIGFMGTLLRDNDFECVVPALERIIEEYKDKIAIEFIGYYPEKLKDYDQVTTMDFIPDYNEFRKFFASRNWDIGLGPLSDTEFNRSKTNNKYREYSSFKIAGIFSDIATYNFCVQNGVNGILTKNTVEGWYSALKKLIDNPKLRTELAENAHQDITRNYNIDRFAAILIDVFNKAYESEKNSQIHNFTAPQGTAPTYQLTRTYDPDLLNFSRPISKPRKYRVFCEPTIVNRIGLLFAHELPCKGIVTINIYIGKHLFRSVSKLIENINFNGWDYFYFNPINGTSWSNVTVEIIPKITEGSFGVYEDKRKRPFLYRLLNRLKMPVKGYDALMVDFG